MSKRILKFLLALTGLAFSSSLLADPKDYTPPSTPELYDVNEPLVPAYVRVKKVKSHPYLGLGVSFGSSRLVDGDGTPKVSWNFVAEGGYIKALSSWTRIDFGLEVMNGTIGNSRNTIKIDAAPLVKVGYGYNVTENLYALLRIGYGLAMAKHEGPQGNTSSETGSILQFGIQLIVPTESSLDILGGFFVSQYGFSDKGTYNAYEGRLGLRYRL